MDKQINNSMMSARDTFITSEINRQEFFDLLWQAVKDTNLNFEELLDDDGEGSVFVKFTGVEPNPTQKWTHDFNFVFTVNTHQSDPDKISPEKIANALLETIQNMDRQEMFERSECYNSFAEELDNEND
mgnify:CR=1 FL=1